MCPWVLRLLFRRHQQVEEDHLAYHLQEVGHLQDLLTCYHLRQAPQAYRQPALQAVAHYSEQGASEALSQASRHPPVSVYGLPV
jgi:hypothetical protein